MNENRQVEVHYINTGFPYTVTESFMDLFEGLTYAQADTSLTGALQDQGGPYWSMIHSSTYKYGYPTSTTNSYYGYNNNCYEGHGHVPRMDGGRRGWDSPPPVYYEELPRLIPIVEGNADAGASANSEQCIATHHHTDNPQVLWQDNIDPDNMTYEELLDLGEAVGTQSRGLSKELISTLPISKYKCSFFLRKKTRSERCVVCQMDYRRGDRQMTLPCKHVYHAGCIRRWLGINKACPVCFAEVLGDRTRH